MPTESQKKWFWEQCGLEQLPATDDKLHWFDKDKEIVSPVDGDTWLPCIDLNNLFQYAVPKLIEEIGIDDTWELLKSWLINVLFNHQDPADSLFELAYTALGGE